MFDLAAKLMRLVDIVIPRRNVVPAPLELEEKQD